MPVNGVIAGWATWVQTLLPATFALGWLTLFAWLFNLTGHRVSSTYYASNQSASGAGRDIYRAGQNMNETVDAPGRDSTRAILRTAVLQQISIGQKLLDSCGRSRPERLQERYVTWLESVTSLLNPDYQDLAQMLRVAPVDAQTGRDFVDEIVAFVHDPLWPEIWKKIRVLREIEFELS